MFAGGDYLLREETQKGFFKYQKGGFWRYSKGIRLDFNRVETHVRSLLAKMFDIWEFLPSTSGPKFHVGTFRLNRTRSTQLFL